MKVDGQEAEGEGERQKEINEVCNSRDEQCDS